MDPSRLYNTDFLITVKVRNFGVFLCDGAKLLLQLQFGTLVMPVCQNKLIFGPESGEHAAVIRNVTEPLLKTY